MNYDPITIPHNKPFFDLSDQKCILHPLESSWVARGPKCIELEKEFSSFILQQKNPELHSVCVSSGTAALYLALKILISKKEESPGTTEINGTRFQKKEIIFPSYTCSAVMNAVKGAGLTPVLCDIDPISLNPSADNYLEKITPKTAGIIITHSHGLPADSQAIQTSINKLRKDIFIIEDCCQSLGASIASKPCGSYSDAAVFSFHATKIITGGLGGLIFFKEPDLRAKGLKYIDYDMPTTSEPRFNFLLSDINASLALSQFKKLKKFVFLRQKTAQRYQSAVNDLIHEISDTSIFAPPWPKALCLDKNSVIQPNFYRFILFVKPDQRKRIILEMNKKNISIINPFEPSEMLHRIYGSEDNYFPGTLKAVQKTISLPIYPSLTDQQTEYIIKNLTEILKQ